MSETPHGRTPAVRRHRRIFYFGVPLTAIVAALLVAELGLRILHPIPYSLEQNMVFEADPDTGYRLKPGGVGTFADGARGAANSRGLRNREVGPKPPGTFRILVLGDSFTVGASVEQDEAYPQVLERILARRTPRPIEVVNTGVGGWDPFQYAQYFAREGLAFEPDLVLVGFFVGNDTYSTLLSVPVLPTAVHGRRVGREAAQRATIDLEVLLEVHSHLARALRGRHFAQFHPRSSCDDFTAGHIAIQRGRLSNHLRRSADQEAAARPNVEQIFRIQQLASLRHVPVVVALLPDENQINPALRARILVGEDPSRYDFSMPQTMLSALFSERGIPVIDLLPAFIADPRCPLYMNNTHWNPAGHVLAAETIAPTLLRWISAAGPTTAHR
jgi:lysophospholipase L1-like esterase